MISLKNKDEDPNKDSKEYPLLIRTRGREDFQAARYIIGKRTQKPFEIAFPPTKEGYQLTIPLYLAIEIQESRTN